MVDATLRPQVPLSDPDSVRHRRALAMRANASLPNDGTAGMQAPLLLDIYTVATLPAAALWTGSLVYVSDDVFPGPAYSDGTDWRRASDGLVVGDSGVVTVTTTSHSVGDERYVLVDDDTAGAAVTIALPASADSDGRLLHIKKLGTTGAVTIDANGSETIDGDTTLIISIQYDAAQIFSDGSGWFIT